MKKILLAVFGAAFLMVGCTKELQTYVEDLNTRVTTLEDLVKQNAEAIQKLQAAVEANKTDIANQITVVSYTENAAGWLLALSNGEKLQLNHGTNGTDGDSWFSDVKVEGDVVVVTLASGGEYRLPYAKAFRLVIENDIAVAPGLMKIPYSVENGTEATEVDAFPSTGYLAEVTAENVEVTVPDPVVNGAVLVWAVDETLNKTSIKKVMLGAPYAKFAEAEEVKPDGGNIEIPVVSNVEIAVLDEIEDWLTYKETKGNTFTVVLAAESNISGAPRSSSVKIVRKTDNLLLETITIAQKPAVPVVLNGTQEFTTIAEALTAAEALTEGTATLVLGGYNFEEAVKIDGAKIKVPVVIDGQEVATISGGIETFKNATTVKNLTIVPVAGVNKSTLGGSYANTGHESGVHITEAGYGVVVENVVFNNTVGDATSVYVAEQKDAKEKVVVKNCKFGGAGQRALQIYGGPVDVLDNEFTAAYSYVMRVGDKAPATVIAGNKFNCASTAAVNVHSSLAAGATITFGDGVTDTNEYAAGIVNVANGGTANAITIAPAAYATLPVANSPIKLNGMPQASLQAAVTAAAAITSGTAVITVDEATTVTEEVKVSGVTVPLTIDGKAQSTTLVGSFEIKRVKATIRNFTINPTATSVTGLWEDGLYTNGENTFGVQIVESGHGVLLENLTINMGIDNGTGVHIGYQKATPERDVLKNLTINGTGAQGRKIQAYNSCVEVDNCTFNGSYSYGVRIAGDQGSDVILKNNRFNAAKDGNAVAIQFYALAKANVVLGDGVKNNNTEDGSYRSIYGAGNEWLFHNNNTFAPELSYYRVNSNNDLQILDFATRVWYHHHGITGTAWDDEICAPEANNWDRHGAIVGKYLYVPSAHKVDTKVAVFDVVTGAHVATITEGFDSQYGLFKLCSIAKLGDVPYVSSMSNSGSLAIYKLTDMGADGYYTKAALAQTIPIPANERFGDDMTAIGTEEEGDLIFLSYEVAGANDACTRTIWEIPVINGAVSNTPKVAPRGITAGGKLIGGLYIYEYTGSPLGQIFQAEPWSYSGTGGERHGFYYSNVGQTGYIAWTWGLDPYGVAMPALETNVQSPKFVTLNGQKYFMYISAPTKQGYLRIVPISGANYKAGFEALPNLDAGLDDISIVCPLVAHGLPNYSGPTNTNGTAFLDYTEIDGDIYIVACVTENGWNCFKLNK